MKILVVVTFACLLVGFSACRTCPWTHQSTSWSSSSTATWRSMVSTQLQMSYRGTARRSTHTHTHTHTHWQIVRKCNVLWLLEFATKQQGYSFESRVPTSYLFSASAEYLYYTVTYCSVTVNTYRSYESWITFLKCMFTVESVFWGGCYSQDPVCLLLIVFSVWLVQFF